MRHLSAERSLATAIAAAVLLASPVSAATVNATANAKVVKPLLLKHLRDLDLGTVVLGPGTWTGATLTLSRTGTRTCAAPLTCSGATQVAAYNVSGSNNSTVRISAPNVILTNQSDSTQTLTMTLDSQASIYLTNSGAPGHEFPVGGSITVNSTTQSGTYVGTFNVTVDY